MLQERPGALLKHQDRISLDGRHVVFQSSADNLVVGDTNGSQDIFRHDRVTGETIRLSVSTGGAEGDDDSYLPVISRTGWFVAYHSDATNLVPGDTNGQGDVFIHDLTDSTTFRASVDTSGNQGDSVSRYGVLSSNGSVLAFQSQATNLDVDDTNAQTDVFVRADISLAFPLDPAPADLVAFAVHHAERFPREPPSMLRR